MLVLSRREGESLVIGDDIIVKVAEVADTRAKFHVTAPRSILILRSELIGEPHDAVKPRTDKGGGLSLSRAVGETIAIGDDIVIHLVRGGSSKALIGVEAPRNVNVRRGELAQA